MTTSVVTPDFDAWDAWRPEYVAERLAGVTVPWCVAAGWALDLFRGEQTRPHEDLEIAVPAARFGTRPKDDADFSGVLPLLDVTARSWLAGALDAVHAGHRWLGRL